MRQLFRDGVRDILDGQYLDLDLSNPQRVKQQLGKLKALFQIIITL